MLHVTCHPSQTWDMISCFPVLRGAQQLQLCCCQYVSIIYSLKLYCFRLVPLIYDVMMWALNMQDWLYFFWAYWASWVWAGHEDTDTWHEDTNLCRTCDILTRSLVPVFANICPVWGPSVVSSIARLSTLPPKVLIIIHRVRGVQGPGWGGCRDVGCSSVMATLLR